MQTVETTGTIQWVEMGTGTWALVTDQGQTYELHNPPPDLQQAGLHVQVQGQIREDIMTLAMIGPVLEVLNHQTLPENLST